MPTRKPLSDVEKRYYEELKAMERERVHFTHGLMCKRLGYRSTARSFQLMTALIEKGWATQGQRLAFIECPVTLPAKAA